METSKIDKTALKIINMTDERSDFAYWQSQPYTARLAALEAIRTEYHTWKYDSKPGFQRVYRVTQLQSS
jgi:hypothetical protein